ncbi:hypothetical protein Ahy_B03g066662 isoform B [Arachis hypogaea]|uniref:Uncharacterized protein n=1 Tax=Arachis hypogaea TaxID=3818 RepID=A0A445A4V1_ARAHY|nr:hypothetical protein Ahy_B03g066662 isoform B [Arachis hypogaea]
MEVKVVLYSNMKNTGVLQSYGVSGKTRRVRVELDIPFHEKIDNNKQFGMRYGATQTEYRILSTPERSGALSSDRFIVRFEDWNLDTSVFELA